MPVLAESVAWYEAQAADLATAYEALQPERVHAWLCAFLPTAPALVLDVGAGSGRDAAWLARLGHDVVAVEPSTAMRAEAARRHADQPVRWVADSLPAMTMTLRLGSAFDLILVSAVWQHVPALERARAMRKLLGLLRPGGLLAITLRHGPIEPWRGAHRVSLEELERLVREQDAMVAQATATQDQGGRDGVTWTGVAVRLPNDGTGALPLLRHVILNDQKSATYKLGLLRAVCRVADGQAGMVEEDGDNSVAVPLGLVALNWLRLYLPLIEADLPQTQRNVRTQGLGFAGAGFETLLGGLVPRLDLRIGARFEGSGAQAVCSAIREAADLIVRMPATFMTYPSGPHSDEARLSPECPQWGGERTRCAGGVRLLALCLN